MTKKEILDYVMHTPYNTNRAVLSAMLEEMSEDGIATDTITLKIINNTDDDMTFYAPVINITRLNSEGTLTIIERKIDGNTDIFISSGESRELKLPHVKEGITLIRTETNCFTTYNMVLENNNIKMYNEIPLFWAVSGNETVTLNKK